MVMAVFRPEAEFTLFLCMCTKDISKTWWKCIPTESYLPVTDNLGRRSEWRGQTFDQKLL